jgi:hypothetical protein
MFIFALKNKRLFEELQRHRFLGKFVSLRVDCLDSVADPGLLAGFYKSFYVDNKTSKETRAGRFAELDDLAVSFLKSDSENLIHDVGVSSGITSVELYDKLVVAGCRFKLFVSDKFARFHATGDAFCRIYDGNDVLTRAYLFSLLSDEKLHWKHFISKYSFALLKRLPRASRPARQIVLYDPRLSKLIKEGRVAEIEYDIFNTTLDSQFTFVRCMNLLNRSYFSPAEISRAIHNLRSSLVEDGVLQVGRTNLQGANEASFFRKVQNRLVPAGDINKGSEIKGLVG